MITHVTSFDSTGTASIVQASYTKQTLVHPFSTFNGAFLGTLYCYFTTAANAPVNCLWKITRDTAGNEPITPVTTTPLVFGEGTATSGGFVASLNELLPKMTPLLNAAAPVTGNVSLYLWVKTDTATSTLSLTESRVSFEADGR